MRFVQKVLIAALFTFTAAALAVPTTGLASAQSPAPGYEQFTGCPNEPQNIFVCQRAQINGGSLTLGNVTTEFEDPIVLTGGVNNAGELRWNDQGGLEASAVRVPGGLSGLTGLPERILNFVTFGLNKVYALPQLVGPVQVTPVGFNMPMRIKLINPLFPSACGIGTANDPITLQLTNGTTDPPPPNQPISGVLPQLGSDPNNPDIILSSNGTYVDNAFGVPGATGCTLGNLGLVDALINLQRDLPSAAGHNEAVFSNVDLHLSAVDNVYP